MKNLTYVQQADLFSALAHPVRLRILDILVDGEACVCHLSAALHQKQAYVSQQLARLKESGLIVDKRDGLFVYYDLADTGIVNLLRAGRQTAASLNGDKSALPETAPHSDKKCPCPKCQAARLVSTRQTATVSAAS